MDEKKQAIMNYLPIQWQDHFDMRGQTWKVLQYSMLFFLGVIGLEIKEIDKTFLISAYAAVLLTSTFGIIIALHHRRRQKEKFLVITAFERELSLDSLMQPVLGKAKRGLTGRVTTASYIIAMQIAVLLVSLYLFVRVLLS